VVYLDDILIFTRIKEEHTKVIQQVLQILQENKLFLHLEKYEFCKEQIEYLGLVILENQISMDLVKRAKGTISLVQAKDAVPGPNCMLKSLWR